MFGVGFSEVFIDTIDPLTGNLNYILQGGFFGLRLLDFNRDNVFIDLDSQSSFPTKDNPYRPSLQYSDNLFHRLVNHPQFIGNAVFLFQHGDLAFAIFTFFAFCLFTMNIADDIPPT
jgi:hypothetical protein